MIIKSIMYKLLIKNKTSESEYIVENRYFQTMESLIEALNAELLGGFIQSYDIIQVIDLEKENG